MANGLQSPDRGEANMKNALLSIVVSGLGVAIVSPKAVAATADESMTNPGSPTTVRVAVVVQGIPTARLEDPVEVVGAVPTYGAMASFDFVSRRNLFFGVASRYTTGIRARGSSAQPMRDFDLLFRLGYDQRLGDRFHAYGYLAPGYSFLNGLASMLGQGPVFGASVGGLLDLTSDFFCLAELGYQAGFQRGFADNMQFRLTVGLVQVGIGLGARI